MKKNFEKIIYMDGYEKLLVKIENAMNERSNNFSCPDYESLDDLEKQKVEFAKKWIISQIQILSSPGKDQTGIVTSENEADYNQYKVDEYFNVFDNLLVAVDMYFFIAMKKVLSIYDPENLPNDFGRYWYFQNDLIEVFKLYRNDYESHYHFASFGKSENNEVLFQRGSFDTLSGIYCFLEILENIDCELRTTGIGMIVKS